VKGGGGCGRRKRELGGTEGEVEAVSVLVLLIALDSESLRVEEAIIRISRF
jgi:hypothetical protein